MAALGATAGYFAFSALHLACLALALTVCGLYGTDLRKHQGSRSDWVYAVIGGMSAVTCLIYFWPFVIRRANLVAAGWSLVLFVLWIAVFGIFGKKFINELGKDGNMTNAVWVDLTSACLWLISGLSLMAYWWKHRDTRSQFTGRAHV